MSVTLHSIPLEIDNIKITIPKYIQQALRAFWRSFPAETKLVFSEDGDFEIYYLWDEWDTETPEWKMWDVEHYENWTRIFEDEHRQHTMPEFRLENIGIEPPEFRQRLVLE